MAIQHAWTVRRRAAGQALALVIGLAALVAIDVGLRALGRLMSGEDLALVSGLVPDRTGPLTSLAHAASVLGHSYVLVPLAAVLGAIALVRGRAVTARVLVTAIVGAVILQDVVKALIDRPRPPVPRLEHPGGSSFPSGHATEITAFLVALALVTLGATRSRALRGLAALVTVVVVVAVSLSRVYLGVHYPTDVGAGVLLGGAWSLVSGMILRRPASKRRVTM